MIANEADRKYMVEMDLFGAKANRIFETREECARFLRSIRDATPADFWIDMTLRVSNGIAVNRRTLDVVPVRAFRMVQVPLILEVA